MPQEKRVTKVEDKTRKKVEATSCRPCFRVRRQGWIWVSLQAMLRLSAGTVYLLSIPLSPTPPSTLQPSRLPHSWLVDIHTLCRTLVPKQSSKSTNLICVIFLLMSLGTHSHRLRPHWQLKTWSQPTFQSHLYSLSDQSLTLSKGVYLPPCYWVLQPTWIPLPHAVLLFSMLVFRPELTSQLCPHFVNSALPSPSSLNIVLVLY